MKILYSIQATGNGHISRAIEILPYLRQYGEVDVFLSGANCALSMPGGTMYRSRGLSFFYNKFGGLDYRKTLAEFKPFRAYKEAKELPVEKYDAVINDFESITSIACKLKGVYSVGFGHQASFQYSGVPMSKKFDPLGKTILKHYAPASDYVGLHFQSYGNSNVFNPIVGSSIYELHKKDFSPKDYGKIVVYLPSYDPIAIAHELKKHRDFYFKIYSPFLPSEFPYPPTNNAVVIQPDKGRFTKDLIHCAAVITSAGFETPAEALSLGKKLMVIPIKGQYEQACNAEALKDYGVPVHRNLQELSDNFINTMFQLPPKRVMLFNSTEQIIEQVMKKFK